MLNRIASPTLWIAWPTLGARTQAAKGPIMPISGRPAARGPFSIASSTVRCWSFSSSLSIGANRILFLLRVILILSGSYTLTGFAVRGPLWRARTTIADSITMVFEQEVPWECGYSGSWALTTSPAVDLTCVKWQGWVMPGSKH